MGDNKMEVFTELIKYEPGFLDRPLIELVPLRFLGEVAVDAYKALIKRIDNIPMAQEEREAKLADGQDAGKALLTIEGKIGELTLEIPKTTGMKFSGEKIEGRMDVYGKMEMDGLSAHKAQLIHKHPEEVEEVIKEAEENQDIPTKTAVLNKIKYKKELERKENAPPKMTLELAGEEFIYKNKLMQVINVLPVFPPKDLTEHGFKELSALAQIIIKRLEVFQNGKKKESLRIGSA